ncbi:N-acetyltransferase [Sphaerisporangium siamense]|uniref:GNAT superfamily N-acetyltransferase n=1 Tax=Sphaerisporangium siamense TaxID=795645 RepID=A0A7W7DA22_9ACTN|nr:GNAT family N-acetyltransferase [Sphaerisporangium siamense]MBB4703048.1 GNAT superfamily N-acetyltransferase [Sphaerisporangium siamense]GII83186.1 N-acetyltransferase [Sphaerisporangium siamense]
MTSDDLLVRQAREDDAEEIYGLTREFALSFRPERAAFHAAFPALLANPDAIVLVAVVDGAVRGYLLGFVHLTLFANGPVAWVEEAITQHGFRRRGLGRALLEEFERWARSRDGGYIALATRRAPEFYNALKYESAGTYYRKVLKADAQD